MSRVYFRAMVPQIQTSQTLFVAQPISILQFCFSKRTIFGGWGRQHFSVRIFVFLLPCRGRRLILLWKNNCKWMWLLEKLQDFWRTQLASTFRLSPLFSLCPKASIMPGPWLVFPSRWEEKPHFKDGDAEGTWSLMIVLNCDIGLSWYLQTFCHVKKSKAICGSNSFSWVCYMQLSTIRSTNKRQSAWRTIFYIFTYI